MRSRRVEASNDSYHRVRPRFEARSSIMAIERFGVAPKLRRYRLGPPECRQRRIGSIQPPGHLRLPLNICGARDNRSPRTHFYRLSASLSSKEAFCESSGVTRCREQLYAPGWTNTCYLLLPGAHCRSIPLSQGAAQAAHSGSQAGAGRSNCGHCSDPWHDRRDS